MKIQLSFCLVFGLLLTPALASATNGMDPISFGARAAGMGGADTAVATDSHAMNTNPAGITQFQHGADLGLSLLMPSLKFNDQVTTQQGPMKINEGVASKSKVFPLISVGYAQHIGNGFHAGLGFYVQGGMGAEFEGLKTFVDDNPTTPIATQPKAATYRTSSQVTYFKFTPTLAYRFKDISPGFDLSVGAAFNVGIANMKFTHTGFQFPESDNDGVYQAHSVDFKSESAFGYAVRGGILASFFHGDLSLGISYQSKASLNFKGTTTMDSMMKYNSNAAFGWPQEFSAGIAGRPLSPLLLSGEVRWVNWSNMLDVVSFTGTAQGQVPQGYENQNMPFRMNWKDQIVLAAGAQLDVIKDTLRARVGYNHASSPARPEGINALFPAVVQDHLTCGVGVTVTKGLTVDGALEIALENTVASNSQNQMAQQPGTSSPNGYAFDVSMRQTSAHLGAGYQF